MLAGSTPEAAALRERIANLLRWLLHAAAAECAATAATTCRPCRERVVLSLALCAMGSAPEAATLGCEGADGLMLLVVVLWRLRRAATTERGTTALPPEGTPGATSSAACVWAKGATTAGERVTHRHVHRVDAAPASSSTASAASTSTAIIIEAAATPAAAKRGAAAATTAAAAKGRVSTKC